MPVSLIRQKWLSKGVAALFDQGLFAGSSFLVNILVARWLPPDQYGAYALAFSIYLAFGSIQSGLLLEPMSVIGPASYRNSLPEYLGRLIPLHFAITLVLGILLGIGSDIFKFYSKSSPLPSALFGVSLSIPCILLFSLWRRAAYLDLRPVAALWGAALNGLTILVLILLVHALGWLSPFNAFALQGIAGIVGSIPIVLLIKPRLKTSWTDSGMRDVLTEHWSYGRWVILTGLVCWLASDAYYVIVGSTLGMSDVGAFRATQNFVKPVSQFISAITLLLIPWASGRFADGDCTSFRRGINSITAIFVSASVIYLGVLMFFGRSLTGFVYGGKYTEFSYLLPLMGLPILLTAAAEGPAIAVRAMRAPSETFWGYSAAAIPTILIGAVLTQRWHLVGAALGLTASSLAFLLVITYRYRLRLKRLASETPQSEADIAPQKPVPTTAPSAEPSAGDD